MSNICWLVPFSMQKAVHASSQFKPKELKLRLPQTWLVWCTLFLRQLMPANVTSFKLHIGKAWVSVGIQSIVLLKLLSEVLTLKAVWGFGERTQNKIVWSRPLVANQASYMFGCVKHPLLCNITLFTLFASFTQSMFCLTCANHESWWEGQACFIKRQFAFWGLHYHWRTFRGLQAMGLVSWILRAVFVSHPTLVLIAQSINLHSDLATNMLEGIGLVFWSTR